MLPGHFLNVIIVKTNNIYFLQGAHFNYYVISSFLSSIQYIYFRIK
jgi:hypothetical protein